MIKFSVNDLHETSRTDLEAILKEINGELQRRRNAEREKLIEDFKKAFYAVKDAGIDIRYLDEYEYEQDTYLRDWDCFSFD